MFLNNSLNSLFQESPSNVKIKDYEQLKTSVALSVDHTLKLTPTIAYLHTSLFMSEHSRISDQVKLINNPTKDCNEEVER